MSFENVDIDYLKQLLELTIKSKLLKEKLQECVKDSEPNFTDEEKIRLDEFKKDNVDMLKWAFLEHNLFEDTIDSLKQKWKQNHPELPELFLVDIGDINTNILLNRQLIEYWVKYKESGTKTLIGD